MRRSANLDGDELSVTRLLLRLIINALAVWVASHIIRGISPLDSPSAILLVALILGLVNALIKPILRFLTCPLQLLTLGLFTLVLNALMLGLTSWIAQQLSIPFQIDGFLAALLGAVVISLVSWVLTSLV